MPCADDSRSKLSWANGPRGAHKGLGDFGGDGKADVIWRNKVTGQNVMWWSGSNVASYLPTIADLDWDFVGQGQ